MRHLLLYDSDNDRDFKADIENMLIESSMEDICIETARRVSEVLKKTIFWKNSHFVSVKDNYDIFLINLKQTDVEGWNFVQYVARNKPHLPVVMISLHGDEWMTKRFIGKFEKKLTSAATKQELISKIRTLLNTGCDS